MSQFIRLLILWSVLALPTVGVAATTYFGTDYETGNTNAWSAGSGGCCNVGCATTIAEDVPFASTVQAHGGTWSADHSVITPGNSAPSGASSFCVRWVFGAGPGKGTDGGMHEGWFSAWYWFGPTGWTNTTHFHNHMQFYTNKSGGGNLIWYIRVTPHPTTGVLQAFAQLENYDKRTHPLTQVSPIFNNVTLPYGGSPAIYGQVTPIPVPRQQWVRFEVYYLAQRDNGIIRIWQTDTAHPSGVQIFDLSEAHMTNGTVLNTLDTTSNYNNTTESRNCADPGHTNPCYTDGVQFAVGNYFPSNAPGTHTLYIDDVLVSSDPIAPADTTAPANPTGFSVTAVDHDTISLVWTAPGDADLAGYDLDYCTGAIDCITWANFAGSGTCGASMGLITSCTAEGLQPSTIYRFRLRAYDEVGCTAANCSTPGAMDDATTAAAPTGISADSTFTGASGPYCAASTCLDNAVVAPDGFETTTWASGNSAVNPHWVLFTFATPQNYNSVTIHWARDAGFNNEYHTSQAVMVQNWNGSAYVDVAPITPTPNTASSSVSFATTSFPRLRLWQDANQGYFRLPGVMWMTEVDLATGTDSTAPGPPTSLTVTGTTSTTATVTWVAPTDTDLAGFTVDRCNPPPSCTTWGSTVELDSPSTLTYTFSGLSAATDYRLRVRAKDGLTPTPNRSTDAIVEATTAGAAAILAKTHHRYYTPGIAAASPISREDGALNVRNAAKVRLRVQIENTGGLTQTPFPLSCDFDGVAPFTLTDSCTTTGMCLAANGGVTQGQASTRYLTLPAARTFAESWFVTSATDLPPVSIGANQVSELEYDLKLLPGLPVAGTDVCCRPVGVTGDACFTVTDGSFIH